MVSFRSAVPGKMGAVYSTTKRQCDSFITVIGLNTVRSIGSRSTHRACPLLCPRRGFLSSVVCAFVSDAHLDSRSLQPVKEEEEKAATKIQAAFRGHKVRKSLSQVWCERARSA